MEARSAQERKLQLDRSMAEAAVDPSAVEPHLPGAMDLRAHELRDLFLDCASLSKALMYSGRGADSDLPAWAMPLSTTLVATGLTHWLFNALSCGLPKLPGAWDAREGEQVGTARLPDREECPAYWDNLDQLQRRSAVAARAARIRHGAPP
eukprot:gene7767-6535_t